MKGGWRALNWPFEQAIAHLASYPSLEGWQLEKGKQGDWGQPVAGSSDVNCKSGEKSPDKIELAKN